TWKSHTFHVLDARFAHRQNGGADFRILHSQPEVFYLDVVSVRDLGFVQQPASLLLRRGQTAELSVVAAGGAPLACRWQRDGIDLVDDGVITGAASATLRIAGVLPEH